MNANTIFCRPFAASRHIPVLPIMIEAGIEDFYKERFGELQFLYPSGGDSTEISYSTKLDKYLDSVLISDELAQRVRKAFDAYIFLSYRKKDRKYANDLMRLIHSEPELRDIAIWFDEFLTPGESFQQNIEKMLDKSELFALLVTPNILEKPNYVMTDEYPMAMEKGKTILPAEMVATDRNELRSDYINIPEPIDASDEAAFHTRLTEAVRRVAVSENDSDPEHNYLIGLAYINGIDVEIDTKRGIDCITAAANAGLPEAMEKLRQMYRNGESTALDYEKAIYWSQKLVDLYTEKYGEESRNTAVSVGNLSQDYSLADNCQKALELSQKAYDTACRVMGKEDPDTLTIANTLANSHVECENHTEALKLFRMLYKQNCSVLGSEALETVAALDGMGTAYFLLGYYENAKKAASRRTVYLKRLSEKRTPKPSLY